MLSFINCWGFQYVSRIVTPVLRMSVDVLPAIICIGNSRICSDIWHKYHKWYFEIVIIWDNFEISRVVFMQNITYKSCCYLFILLPAKGL